MTRIWLDFQDGAGEVEVTYLLRPGATISPRFMNEQYGHSQGTAQCELNYDPDILEKLITATLRILVRMTSGSAPLFSGHIPPTMNLESIGTRDGVSPISIEAIDSTPLLDIPFPESIVFEGKQLCNPSVPANSLVHIIAGIAGITQIAVVEAMVVVPCFSVDKDENILSVFNQLLLEYGYGYRFDESGVLVLSEWNKTEYIPIATVDETNRSALKVDKIEISEGGVKLKWNEVKTKSDVLLYQCDMPVATNGLRGGWPVQPNHFYPEEAELRPVWFEYDGAAIDYRIGSKNGVAVGVKENDYQGILRTSGHRLEESHDDGLVIDRTVFENLRAQVRYSNPGAAPINVYYCNVRADVAYRGADHETIIGSAAKQLVVSGRFLFTAEMADRYASGLYARLINSKYRYRFSSMMAWPVGGILRLTDILTGTDVKCIVISRDYSCNEKRYTYRLVAASALITNISTTLIHNGMVRRPDSVYTEYLFIRSEAKPDRPTLSAPPGWSINPSPGDLKMWIIGGTKYLRSGVLIGDWSDPVVFDGATGVSAVSVTIQSSKGSIFRPGTASTTLEAIVFQGIEEVTSKLASGQFRWRRVSNSPVDDLIWNSNHNIGFKTIVVTPADVNGTTTFSCDIIEL